MSRFARRWIVCFSRAFGARCLFLVSFEVGSILVVQKDGRGWGWVCTFVLLWEFGWEDLRDGCAALLVFRVGSARTLMGKGVPPMVGERW